MRKDYRTILGGTGLLEPDAGTKLPGMPADIGGIRLDEGAYRPARESNKYEKILGGPSLDINDFYRMIKGGSFNVVELSQTDLARRFPEYAHLKPIGASRDNTVYISTDVNGRPTTIEERALAAVHERTHLAYGLSDSPEDEGKVYRLTEQGVAGIPELEEAARNATENALKAGLIAHQKVGSFDIYRN